MPIIFNYSNYWRDYNLLKQATVNSFGNQMIKEINFSNNYINQVQNINYILQRCNNKIIVNSQENN